MFFCLSSFISFFNLKFDILLKNRSNKKKVGHRAKSKSRKPRKFSFVLIKPHYKVIVLFVCSYFLLYDP